jgi:hypothetical protein
MNDSKKKAGMKRDHAAKADKQSAAAVVDKPKEAVQESKKREEKGKRA